MPASIDRSRDVCASTRTAPVTADLVRKAQPAEVLITDWRPLSSTTEGATHSVTAQWPTDHRFYKPDADAYSPLLFTETIRQSLALLSHSAHHIPLYYRLGWEYCSSSLDPAALSARDPEAEVALTVTHLPLASRRKSGSARMAAHITATRGHQPLGAAQIRYSAHPKAIYDRLRGHHAQAQEATRNALAPPPPVPAHHVGRVDAQDVVLAPTALPRRWQLRTDTAHPVLFDHPHDHVPGMVLLEAATQATRHLAGPTPVTPVTMHTWFSRYTELDSPCWIDATALERPHPAFARTEITGVQDDQVTFTSHIIARS